MTSVRERGSTTILGVVAIGLLMMVVVAMIAAMGAVAIRIETDTAADAAALAAVGAAIGGRNPHAAAGAAAAANGARLDRCDCPEFEGDSFTASVGVSRAIRVPLFGDLVIRVERSAEYSAGT